MGLRANAIETAVWKYFRLNPFFFRSSFSVPPTKFLRYCAPLAASLGNNLGLVDGTSLAGTEIHSTTSLSQSSIRFKVFWFPVTSTRTRIFVNSFFLLSNNCLRRSGDNASRIACEAVPWAVAFSPGFSPMAVRIPPPPAFQVTVVFSQLSSIGVSLTSWEAAGGRVTGLATACRTGLRPADCAIPWRGDKCTRARKFLSLSRQRSFSAVFSVAAVSRG